MRILMAFTPSEHWYVIQFDIKTAFLNGDMGKLVQGAHRWQQKFEKDIDNFGLKPTQTDPAVYILQDK
ncbi:hypothetical protein CROQUDRAFT_99362 [Cronartium quercuum f. sp. fusiforme G11]|uniref:Reverse transcriptase Ty1/copia-type domain-containing protein n=1 Tax=Cronartium quercuum f. sp. fusiforme G11 TaxID=708437 RepID=A0A9P6NBX5_9BASI|nr:hypothetical protein CROQUDRAFT_99362 [Cronartium quercuum f. sp. fusiforme G11]